MTIKQAQMSTKITQIIILYASILGSCVGCQKLSSLDVPQEVRSAFAKGYPNAKFSTWDKETFEGNLVYEAEGVIVGKISRNVTYAPEGTVVRVERPVPVACLPP